MSGGMAAEGLPVKPRAGRRDSKEAFDNQPKCRAGQRRSTNFIAGHLGGLVSATVRKSCRTMGRCWDWSAAGPAEQSARKWHRVADVHRPGHLALGDSKLRCRRGRPFGVGWATLGVGAATLGVGVFFFFFFFFFFSYLLGAASLAFSRFSL